MSQIPDFCIRCYFCSCFRTVINTLRYRVCALVFQVCPNFSDLTAVQSFASYSVHPSPMALTPTCKLVEFIWVLEAYSGQFGLRIAVAQPNPVRPQTPALHHKSSLKEKELLLKGSCSIKISLYRRGQLRTPCFFDTSLNKHTSACIKLNKYYFSWMFTGVQTNAWLKPSLYQTALVGSASQQHGCKVAKLWNTTAERGGEFRTQLLHPFRRGVSSINKPFSAKFLSPAREGRE